MAFLFYDEFSKQANKKTNLLNPFFRVILNTITTFSKNKTMKNFAIW